MTVGTPARSSSSSKTYCCSRLQPGPPYSSGQAVASQPFLPERHFRAAHVCCGEALCHACRHLPDVLRIVVFEKGADLRCGRAQGRGLGVRSMGWGFLAFRQPNPRPLRPKPLPHGKLPAPLPPAGRCTSGVYSDCYSVEPNVCITCVIPDERSSSGDPSLKVGSWLIGSEIGPQTDFCPSRVTPRTKPRGTLAGIDRRYKASGVATASGIAISANAYAAPASFASASAALSKSVRIWRNSRASTIKWV